ncbi:MAG: nucleotidyltransferase domain-containing protein [Candidatus Woesearchaeota archaeon]
MSDTKRRVLEALFTTFGDVHIRLLARITSLHPNTVIAALDELESEELIVRIPDERTQRILVRPGRYFAIRKTAYTIESLHRSGLIDALNDAFSYPTIILFGSYARGENHERSDLDLFIISDVKRGFDASAYECFGEIHLFVHTPEEFEKLRKSSAQLISNVLNGIIISGYVEWSGSKRSSKET